MATHMKLWKHTPGLIGALLVATSATLQAQQPAPADERVGRIVAVAGDSIIMNFALDEALLVIQSQGAQVPTSGPQFEALRLQVLNDLVDRSLLLQAAARDTTIVVPEEQVNRMVQQDLDQRQRAVGGPVAFDAALRTSGLTLQEFRQYLTQQIRAQGLIEMYQAAQRRSRQAPRVTEAQMRRVLEERRHELPPRPTLISFQQVVIPPQPSAEARRAANLRADSIYARLRAREDFAQVARRFSDDAETRELGGDLGWWTRDDLQPAFQRVVFDEMLRQGEISAPFLTARGYHIAKLERIRGAERQVRHILIALDMDAADHDRTRALADSVADLLRAGGDMTALHRQFGDPDEHYHVPNFAVQDLPAPYDQMLNGVQAGQIVGPFEIQSEDGTRKWTIVRVSRYDDTQEWHLGDPLVREQLRSNLAQQMLDDEIIRDLRRRAYVDIRL
jgi:hypothetical protein